MRRCLSLVGVLLLVGIVPSQAEVKVLAVIQFHLPPTTPGTLPVSVTIVHIPTGRTETVGRALSGALLADKTALRTAIITRILDRATEAGLSLTEEEIALQGDID